MKKLVIASLFMVCSIAAVIGQISATPKTRAKIVVKYKAPKKNQTIEILKAREKVIDDSLAVLKDSTKALVPVVNDLTDGVKNLVSVQDRTEKNLNKAEKIIDHKIAQQDNVMNAPTPPATVVATEFKQGRDSTTSTSAAEPVKKKGFFQRINIFNRHR